MTFAEQSRAHRLAVGLSQNATARAAGLDPAYVLRIERGQHIPSRCVVLQLARTFGLDPIDRDRYLFLAGHAPEIDYQSLYLDVARRLAMIDRAFAGLPRLDDLRSTVTEVAS